MRKTIILYGLSLAILAIILKFLEYRFIISDLTLEIYIGSIAVIFTLLGAWAGHKFLNKKPKPDPPAQVTFEINKSELQKVGISTREYEVLSLMAEGCSNQEIADKLFVSVNTIKTHSVNLYNKLDVKRRTQAIQKAKELQLLP